MTPTHMEHNELRCSSCKRLLAKRKSTTDCEIKCNRCGTLNIVFEHIHEQIIITDKEGIILFVNPETEAVTGYTAQETIGKKPSLWGGHMSPDFYKQLWRVIKEEKKTIRVQVRNKRKDGSFYTADLHITPVLDATGDIHFFVGVETVVNTTTIEKKYD